MTQKSPSSYYTPERCQYRTATGRQCCSPVVDPDSSFCARHASSEPDDSEDFSVALPRGPAASRTRRALTIPSEPSILSALKGAYRHAAPARSLTSAACSCARFTAIDTDLYPKAGRPGFDVYGKPVPPHNTEPAADDAGQDGADQNEEPAKSQKPN